MESGGTTTEQTQDDPTLFSLASIAQYSRGCQPSSPPHDSLEEEPCLYYVRSTNNPGGASRGRVSGIPANPVSCQRHNFRLCLQFRSSSKCISVTVSHLDATDKKEWGNRYQTLARTSSYPRSKRAISRSSVRPSGVWTLSRSPSRCFMPPFWVITVTSAHVLLAKTLTANAPLPPPPRRLAACQPILLSSVFSDIVYRGMQVSRLWLLRRAASLSELIGDDRRIDAPSSHMWRI